MNSTIELVLTTIVNDALQTRLTWREIKDESIYEYLNKASALDYFFTTAASELGVYITSFDINNLEAATFDDFSKLVPNLLERTQSNYSVRYATPFTPRGRWSNI